MSELTMHLRLKQGITIKLILNHPIFTINLKNSLVGKAYQTRKVYIWCKAFKDGRELTALLTSENI